MSSQSKDISDLARWVREVGAWKSEHRRLRELLGQIDATLRQRERAVEDALWIRAHAVDANEARGAEKSLGQALAAVEREQSQTRERLEAICSSFEAVKIESSRAITMPEERTPQHATEPVSELKDEDRLREANRGSFPASDPPSFNPGRA